ncbi:hypothetical protein Pelo_4803 [Pelomyxa schiedti]|nr:hypothetical protein Pelo_4803 [Pelomyxa schiedti]
MYQQRPGAEAYDWLGYDPLGSLGPKAEDYGPSTADAPPQPLHPADMVAACAAKKRALAAYTRAPTKCAHCPAMIIPNDVAELRNGNLVRFCRGRGGCNQSEVIFVMPPKTVARWGKIKCMFVSSSHRPTMCARCGENLACHGECKDPNGWVIQGETEVPLPHDWPTWGIVVPTGSHF